MHSKKIYWIIASFLLLFGASSCVDDLDIKNGKDWSEETEGGLVLEVSTTRGGMGGDHDQMVSVDKEETVINSENFHVVLFNSKGSVKQIWANQELSKIQEFDPLIGQTRTKYFVKIPRKFITPQVIDVIRNEGFKIAVFANWSSYPDFTTERSIDPENGLDKNNIFYTSHCLFDDSYKINENVGPEMDDSEVFKFITGAGFKMGIAQEWVVNRFNSDEEAEEGIRTAYTLNDDGTGEFRSHGVGKFTNNMTYPMDPYTYYNVWNIWNFGGEANLNDNFYKTSNPYVHEKWATVNNDCLKLAFDDNDQPLQINNSKTVRGLSVVGTSNSVINGVTRNGVHGIVLKQTNRKENGVQKIETADGCYLHYKAPADGYLYVKCRAVTPGAKLVARRGQLTTDNAGAIFSRAADVSTEMETIEYDYKTDNQHTGVIRVTGEPADVALYAIGGDIEIYEIDYIKSRMIALADRQMILPTQSPEGGISMYGVQDFEKVPEDIWPDGTTFNLSRLENTHTGINAASYKYRTISLLRSVAKVEVLVPASIFPEPSHMYLRTINRFSRSAPLDVFTPTNIIWDGWAHSSGYTQSEYTEDNGNTHYYSHALGIDAEAERIRQNGFTYEYGNNDLHAYQQAVTWLFGIWNTEYGWTFNGADGVITPNNGPYPRVFNTRIARTDYAHMLRGEDIYINGVRYYYYFAYMPEKNLTDPNTKGALSDTPKVMRVEMRFADRNEDVNLDDNGAYRIYFMPGGKGQGINNRDDYDGNMERGDQDDNSVMMQNLKAMYPVMRNHQYRFTIKGLEMNNLKVSFDVRGAESRDVNYEFD